MKCWHVLMLTVVFAGWFVSFCLDCYWYDGTTHHKREHGSNHQPPYQRDTLDNTFWFMQISDIHISAHYDPGRHEDLRKFINEVVTTVHPAAVFVTGDITDAKGKDQIFAQQQETEWKQYQQILKDSSAVLRDTPWIDLRGNHDAFDVPWRNHPRDMYRRYAANVHNATIAFKWTHVTNHGRYSFVGVDACPSIGLKRPYNFFGILQEDDLGVIEKVMKEADGDNMTVLLTHYPSSTITTNRHRMKKIFSGAIAHLCGHLHNAGNSINKMYGRHPDGHLELELSDWKHNRRYRLLAIDHDLLSFTDTSLNEWPLVLVTNPINAQFIVPHLEPIGRMTHSTHIRVLVFSPWDVVSVKVAIDSGPYQIATLSSPGSPLYVLPWEPKDYSHGLHVVKVLAKDSANNEMKVRNVFSLDGSEFSMSKAAQYVLLTDHRSFSRMVFLITWLLMIASLLVSRTNNGCGCLYYLTSYSPIFYPFFFFIVYFGIGPWYIGEVLNEVYGVVFVHGVLVSGHFIHGSTTYIHGGVELITFYLPMMLLISYLLMPRCRQSLIVTLLWIPTTVVIVIVSVWSLNRVVSSYGWLTILVSPGYFWGMLLMCLLILIAIRKKLYYT